MVPGISCPIVIAASNGNHLPKVRAIERRRIRVRGARSAPPSRIRCSTRRSLGADWREIRLADRVVEIAYFGDDGFRELVQLGLDAAGDVVEDLFGAGGGRGIG